MSVMSRKNLIKAALLSLISLSVLASCGPRYSYETVPDDPMNARIYTLDNGLKVYMTVNPEAPRIQTFVAVHVGSKNDPSETTGLAHYFEHLMFKGTQSFGTQNYALEQPMLDRIEELFEVYRKTTDPLERKAIYRQIDSISLEASRLSIPNEYDKLMSAIGASGTNAWTSYDETVYTEDIPSNQVENWAKIQADRFAHNVIRGFHTELETVYEEMNMYSVMDSEKVIDKLMASLFPDHPYGQQTVIGKQDHLKNPSITNIKNYYKTYYVPNNIAICLSGDFNPDEMIAVIDKHFGSWEPNPDLPLRTPTESAPITEPVMMEVTGLESEYLTLAWHGPHVLSDEDVLFTILGEVLNNGKAGIIDLDLIQQQKILSAAAMPYTLADRSALVLQGNPKEGQSLDQVKELLLGSLAKVRNGEFEESLLKAIVNNNKLNFMRQLESNRGRANQFVRAYINDIPWDRQVKYMDRMAAVTKEDLVAFTNKYFKDNNYIAIYKKQGVDTTYKKIEKPEITPIFTNRDTSSVFLKEILTAEVKPIEPVFVDFEKDFAKTTIKEGASLVYVPNKMNDLFTIQFVYEIGSLNDKALPLAFSYLEYLGTSDMKAEDIQKAFYQLACSFSASVNANSCTVTLSGLSENMEPAMELLGKLMKEARPDDNVYRSLVTDMLKSRADAKSDQRTNFQRLVNYTLYGPLNILTNILSEKELESMNPKALTDKVNDLLRYNMDVYYYGPAEMAQVSASVGKLFPMAQELLPLPEKQYYKLRYTQENTVYLAQYDANQMYYSSYSVLPGETYDKVPYVTAKMYNEYFGSSMNAIVFQEMREARGLAYSASASYQEPERRGEDFPYVFSSFIATQNDKMAQAMEAFHDIINDMPQSEKSFNLAKEGLISGLRTQRITGRSLLNYYRQAKYKDVWEDTRKTLYDGVQNMTLQDLVAFQEQWIRNRRHNYCILSDIKALDMKELAKYGKVTVLSQKEIFGY